jgi:hypothetical protein
MILPLSFRPCYEVDYQNKTEVVRKIYLHDLCIGFIYLFDKTDFKVKLFLAEGSDSFYLCHKDGSAATFQKAIRRATELVFSIPATIEDRNLSSTQWEKWADTWKKNLKTYLEKQINVLE